MQILNHDDTIAAISTAIGQAGIGIVRLSGKGALGIADMIFKSKDGISPLRFKTYTVHYGWVVDNARRKTQSAKRSDVVDEVILTVMRKPKTYTKEDVVEINCHSGLVNLRAILNLVLQSGARLAEPGEFTRRAFLNGRIDLTQAEAVVDIIRAKTEASLKLSIEQLKGRLSEKIESVCGLVLEIFAHLEASIDFPEEDISPQSLKQLRKKLDAAILEISRLIETSSKGKILREGIKVVIAGRPNVGKSSLLNAILKEERAIVTPIPGTTRDTIEEGVNVRGLPLRFFDTAGVLTPRDIIEHAAVTRTHKTILDADIILLVVDGSRRLSAQDTSFIKQFSDKRKIIVVNKIDLAQKVRSSQLKPLSGSARIIKISALKHKGLVELEEAIVKEALPGELTGSDEVIVSNIRHIEALKKAQSALSAAQTHIAHRLSAELVSLETKEALQSLDSILGKSVDNDLLDKIFSEFCVGK